MSQITEIYGKAYQSDPVGTVLSIAGLAFSACGALLAIAFAL